jgi:excisionase family DNA binding protein
MAEGGMGMLTVQELSRRMEVPERTIRRWIDAHGPFLGARKDGRRLLVPEDSFKVAETIKSLYAGGATSADVNDTLAGRNVPQVLEVDAVTPAQAESLVRALTEELRQAREEIQELRQEIRETRDAVAATQETVEEIGEWIRVKPDEEKRPWWARLLKR